MIDHELYHHGVLGMKWGVRRYQNKDGTLTKAGKQRFADVYSDPKKNKRDTKRAIKILKTNQARYLVSEDIANRRAKRASEKNDSLLEKQSIAVGKEYAKASKRAEKMLIDIADGKIKAGRDFIVQRDYNIYPVLPFLVYVNSEDKIIDRKK